WSFKILSYSECKDAHWSECSPSIFVSPSGPMAATDLSFVSGPSSTELHPVKLTWERSKHEGVKAQKLFVYFDGSCRDFLTSFEVDTGISEFVWEPSEEGVYSFSVRTVLDEGNVLDSLCSESLILDSK